MCYSEKPQCTLHTIFKLLPAACGLMNGSQAFIRMETKGRKIILEWIKLKC